MSKSCDMQKVNYTICNRLNLREDIIGFGVAALAQIAPGSRRLLVIVLTLGHRKCLKQKVHIVLVVPSLSASHLKSPYESTKIAYGVGDLLARAADMSVHHSLKNRRTTKAHTRVT